MKHSRKSARADFGESVPVPQIRVISPDAVFRLDELRAILGLPMTCLKREARLGRLRVSRRSGRYWVTGRWVMAWIEGGEVDRKSRNEVLNGVATKH